MKEVCRMLNKKMMTSAVLLGMMSLGFAGQAFADEGDTQIIEGMKGETSADVTTRGNLGDVDPTDPITPLPEGDNRWIKVTLPTAVVFESTDKKNISTPINTYEIKNESGRPVKVDVLNYNIDGGNGVAALDTLNIKRSAGYDGNEIVPLVSGGAKVGENLPEVKEFVRLANNEGKIGDVTDGDKSTKFEFTGTMTEGNLEADKNYVDSKLTFKFTALRMDGKTVEEAK